MPRQFYNRIKSFFLKDDTFYIFSESSSLTTPQSERLLPSRSVMILSSDRYKSFDIFYPEVASVNQTFKAGVKLQTLSATNSGVFRPYSKSKFRFDRHDLV